VNATDVEQCILYLSTQGIDVDVSARGSVTCDINGCTGEGSAGIGCSMTGGGTEAAGFLMLVGMAAVIGRRRRKH
jgi:MYXO-CTERM domain-containing protein